MRAGPFGSRVLVALNPGQKIQRLESTKNTQGSTLTIGLSTQEPIDKDWVEQGRADLQFVEREIPRAHPAAVLKFKVKDSLDDVARSLRHPSAAKTDLE